MFNTSPVGPIEATVRRVDVEIDATHHTDDDGPYSLIAVTTIATGEPLIEDLVVDGHITLAELYDLAGDLASGRVDPLRLAVTAVAA